MGRREEMVEEMVANGAVEVRSAWETHIVLSDGFRELVAARKKEESGRQAAAPSAEAS